MTLSDILTPQSVVLDVPVSCKREVFHTIASCARKAFGCEEASVFEAFWEREHLGSTGFGRGIALPIARIPLVKREMCGVFLRLSSPVSFGAIDDHPVYLIFALLLKEKRAFLGHDLPASLVVKTPPKIDSRPLRALSRLSRLFRDRAFIEKLKIAPDAPSAYALLCAKRIGAQR